MKGIMALMMGVAEGTDGDVVVVKRVGVVEDTGSGVGVEEASLAI